MAPPAAPQCAPVGAAGGSAFSRKEVKPNMQVPSDTASSTRIATKKFLGSDFKRSNHTKNSFSAPKMEKKKKHGNASEPFLLHHHGFPPTNIQNSAPEQIHIHNQVQLKKEKNSKSLRSS